MAEKEIALIVGAGSGLSASLARLCASEGMAVAVAARNTEKLAPICDETGASAYVCDAVDGSQVDQLFDAVGADLEECSTFTFKNNNRAIANRIQRHAGDSSARIEIKKIY